jgi:hypothetical protein
MLDRGVDNLQAWLAQKEENSDRLITAEDQQQVKRVLMRASAAYIVYLKDKAQVEILEDKATAYRLRCCLYTHSTYMHGLACLVEVVFIINNLVGIKNDANKRCQRSLSLQYSCAEQKPGWREEQAIEIDELRHLLVTVDEKLNAIRRFEAMLQSNTDQLQVFASMTRVPLQTKREAEEAMQLSYRAILISNQYLHQTQMIYKHVDAIAELTDHSIRLITGAVYVNNARLAAERVEGLTPLPPDEPPIKKPRIK